MRDFGFSEVLAIVLTQRRDLSILLTIDRLPTRRRNSRGWSVGVRQSTTGKSTWPMALVVQAPLVHRSSGLVDRDPDGHILRALGAVEREHDGVVEDGVE